MISHLFKNGIIVTVNPDREIFFHGAVAVKDDRIVEVGPTEAMEAKYTDCERVTDLEGRVMFPGFVNTHNHLFQTLLRGLGDDMVLKDWLETMTFPAATNLTPDDCYHGAMLGLMEGIHSGITTNVDYMYPHPREGLDKGHEGAGNPRHLRQRLHGHRNPVRRASGHHTAEGRHREGRQGYL